MLLLQELGVTSSTAGRESAGPGTAVVSHSHRGWVPTVVVEELGCLVVPMEMPSRQGLVEVPWEQKLPQLPAQLC